MGAANTDTASDRLAAMLRGQAVTQLVAAAVRLRIPDHLDNATRTDLQLAERTGIDVAILRRYLRALVALGLVDEVEPGRYRATASTGLLRSGTGQVHGHALMSGADYYQAWSELDHALRTGRSAYEHRHGRALWERFVDDPGLAASFARTMGWNTDRQLPEILAMYPFPTTGVLADLGTGDGSLVAGVLRRRPGLQAIAVEQPTMVAHVRRTLDERGVSDRCEVVAQDIRTQVPAGADLYVLKSVLHNWHDDEALRILRNVRVTMPNDSQVLIIERVFSDDDPLVAAVRDLTMLVLFGSRDRTVEEYRALLEEAGFVVGTVTTGRSGLSVLSARPSA